MKKRMQEFCESQNLDHRWCLICEIEHLLNQTNKAATLASIVGNLCILPFLVLTFLKIMWSTGFMADNRMSPFYQFMSDVGFISWGHVLGGLFASCICATILAVILYNIRRRSGSKIIPERLCGTDDFKAQQIALKAANLSISSDTFIGGLSLTGFGGPIVTVLINNFDQNYGTGTSIFTTLITAFFHFFVLVIPFACAAVCAGIFVSLPIDEFLSKIKLEKLKTNADSEWVRLDTAEAARRAKKAEEVKKAADASNALRIARETAASSIASPPQSEIPTIVDINTGLPMSSDGTDI